MVVGRGKWDAFWPPPIAALLPATEMPPLPLPGGAMQCQTLSRLRHAPETDAVWAGRCPLGGRAAAPSTGLHHPLLQLHEAVSLGHPRKWAPLCPQPSSILPSRATASPTEIGEGRKRNHRCQRGVSAPRVSLGTTVPTLRGGSLDSGTPFSQRASPLSIQTGSQNPGIPLPEGTPPLSIQGGIHSHQPQSWHLTFPVPPQSSFHAEWHSCQLGSWHPSFPGDTPSSFHTGSWHPPFLGGIPSSFHTRWHLCPPTWIPAPHFPKGTSSSLSAALPHSPGFGVPSGHPEQSKRKSLKKTEPPTAPH